MLGLLVAAARAGRLTIAPQRVSNSGEPLLPEIREGILQTWGSVVFNTYTASDPHIIAASCGSGTGMHLNDDTLIVEPVDDTGRPVGVGERAAKVYLTSLFNLTLPLIRYELTDEVTFLDEPCVCGCTSADCGCARPTGRCPCIPRRRPGASTRASLSPRGRSPAGLHRVDVAFISDYALGCSRNRISAALGHDRRGQHNIRGRTLADNLLDWLT